MTKWGCFCCRLQQTKLCWPKQLEAASGRHALCIVSATCTILAPIVARLVCLKYMATVNSSSSIETAADALTDEPLACRDGYLSSASGRALFWNYNNKTMNVPGLSDVLV